jgi:uncharacterized repeat protein (TIGR01451 family)
VIVHCFSRHKFRNARPLAVASMAVAIAFGISTTAAEAAGTAAGTTISNTATATYNDPGGTELTTPSNTVDILVDELLDVTVATADPGDMPAPPAGTNQVLSFTVRNNGNGSEAFRLTPNSTIGGDQFDPTTTSIVIDNGNGVYDPGIDVVYTPGSNDPVLAPDTSVKIFILSTIPGGAADGSRGIVTLTAAAVTGTGAPGTSFPGLGQGGGDAVVGSSGADSVDQGAYVVQNATVSLLKSATILDPFGGAESVPGAIITYTLVATVTGSGTLSNLTIGDVVPLGTAYRTGSITLQGSGLSDAVDADAGEFASSAVAVRLGALPGGTTRTVTFKVRIN